MQRISNENSNFFLQYNDMTVVAARGRTLKANCQLLSKASVCIHKTLVSEGQQPW